MISKQRRLEIQTQAVRGFSTWLRASPPTDTDEGREFNDQLVYTLEIYQAELQRQLDGTPATQDWLNILSATGLLALLLKDEMFEINPALEEYRPEDEPMTIEEMIVRLLSDAIDSFSKSGQSDALAPISDMVQRVLQQQSPKIHSV